jgi:uncharacterized protein (TIGR03084 family)
VSEHAEVYADLAADGQEVDQLVADLPEDGWARATPAPGWTVAHQVAHLAATFRLAGLAASNPAAFTAVTSKLSDDFDANVRMAMAEFLAEKPADLLGRWRSERDGAQKALSALPPEQQVPWLVRPLPAGVLAAAGMMELFGHGQDIADALGVRRTRTGRLRHLVGFAVRTWDFGYQARGMRTPETELRFEITAPSGGIWAFGPEDSPERVSGPAEDFCLLVTRRRHHRDLRLTTAGDEAARWLELAQAYRGPAGPGRAPGQFADAAHA